MERVGTKPKVQHFLGGLALAHTGCKVTISEKPDITCTKVAHPINARAQLIDIDIISGSLVKSCYVKCWFGFAEGFWWWWFLVFFFELGSFSGETALCLKCMSKMSKHSAIVWSY